MKTTLHNYWRLKVTLGTTPAPPRVNSTLEQESFYMSPNSKYRPGRGRLSSFSLRHPMRAPATSRPSHTIIREIPISCMEQPDTLKQECMNGDLRTEKMQDPIMNGHIVSNGHVMKSPTESRLGEDAV